MRLRKQVYIYFISYFINAALSFGTISLLTHHLTPYDYGIINLYSSFLVFLTPFITAGILYPISIEYFKSPREKYNSYFTNAQVIPLISVVVFTILCIAFQHPLSQLLKVPGIWIWIIPLTAWWVMINETVLILTRNNNKPFQFTFFSIGKNLTEIGMTIILVLGLHMAWQGRLLSAAIAPALLGMISLYLIHRWGYIMKNITWAQVRTIFLISFPFIFERLAVFVIGYSDKYFIDRYDLKGTDQVGLYSVGAQIATIISLVILSMNSAYQPYIYQNIASGHKERAKRTTWMYIGAAGLLIGVLFLIIPVIFRFFIGHKFEGAKAFAYYLGGGYFMWGVYNAFLVYLLFHGKNRLILYLSLAGMILSIALNFFMVPRYGAYGAAITSIITYSFMALLSVTYSWKYFK